MDVDFFGKNNPSKKKVKTTLSFKVGLLPGLFNVLFGVRTPRV
jgi:hypothetical protein